MMIKVKILTVFLLTMFIKSYGQLQETNISIGFDSTSTSSIVSISGEVQNKDQADYLLITINKIGEQKLLFNDKIIFNVPPRGGSQIIYKGKKFGLIGSYFHANIDVGINGEWHLYEFSLKLFNKDGSLGFDKTINVKN